MFFSLALLSGCGGSTTSAAQSDPRVRFINASPAATGLDFFMDSTAAASGVSYLGSSTDFAEFEFIDQTDGGYDVAVRVAGSSTDLDVIAPEPPFLNRNTDNVIFAFGLPNPGGELIKRIRILPVIVGRTAPVGNKARLLVFNFLQRATGFENADITFQTIDPGDPTSIDNPLFKRESLVYGADTTSTPLLIDSGTLTWIARLADVDGVTEFARTTFTAGAGKLYIVLITGKEGSSDASLAPKIQFIEYSSKL